jgi:uncharacterized protein YdiU (UPF0061 family)
VSEKSGGDPGAAAERLTEAFGETYGRVVKSAVDAQQRNVNLAQGWVEGVTGVLESQAETNRALTRAMQSYVTVVDEALKSQERTNRALTESLESYKEVVGRVSDLQDRNTEMTRNFFESMTNELKNQTQTNEALAREVLEGSQKQWEASQKVFFDMFREAMESYANLFGMSFPPYGRRKDQ